MQAAMTKVQIWGPAWDPGTGGRVKWVPYSSLSVKVTSVPKNSTAHYDLQSPPVATSFLTVQTSAQPSASSASPIFLPAELASSFNVPPFPPTPLVSGWEPQN